MHRINLEIQSETNAFLYWELFIIILYTLPKKRKYGEKAWSSRFPQRKAAPNICQRHQHIYIFSEDKSVLYIDRRCSYCSLWSTDPSFFCVSIIQCHITLVIMRRPCHCRTLRILYSPPNVPDHQKPPWLEIQQIIVNNKHTKTHTDPHQML